jgi:hypothetical protein
VPYRHTEERVDMRKIEIVENIIIVLNWGQENKEYKNRIIDALNGVNWYLSNELMTRVLVRLSRERLIKIQHDVIEAIY